MAHYILNDKLNGVEIYFDSKPEESIRSEMKASGFRWSQRQGMWYARKSETTLAIAKKLGEQGKGVVRPERSITKSVSKANQKSATVSTAILVNEEFNVKVGDLFVLSFGYDATMYRYFQVVAIKGKCTVILREVCAEHLGGSFMCWKEKPIKNKFVSNETITVRLRKVGGMIYAGKYYLSSWDKEYDCDDFH